MSASIPGEDIYSSPILDNQSLLSIAPDTNNIIKGATRYLIPFSIKDFKSLTPSVYSTIKNKNINNGTRSTTIKPATAMGILVPYSKRYMLPKGKAKDIASAGKNITNTINNSLFSLMAL